MLRLHVITASTRQGRKGPAVAEWFLERARQSERFEVEPIDLAAIDLPLFDEPKHPRHGEYAHAHTRAWSEIVARADAYVVVTPEYDHGPPAALLNALQYLVNEWAYKPMGFVSYGGVSGGTRSTELLKTTVTTLKMMPMFETVSIPFFAQYIDATTGRFEPPAVQAEAASAMLAELGRWAGALRQLRS